MPTTELDARELRSEQGSVLQPAALVLNTVPSLSIERLLNLDWLLVGAIVVDIGDRSRSLYSLARKTELALARFE